MLVSASAFAGNNHCVATKGVIQHCSVSYNDTILEQKIQIGLKSCIDTCDTTGGCTHINYNRRDLKCDLMAGPDGGNEESYKARHMSYASLETEAKVRNF